MQRIFKGFSKHKYTKNSYVLMGPPTNREFKEECFLWDFVTISNLTCECESYLYPPHQVDKTGNLLRDEIKPSDI